MRQAFDMVMRVVTTLLGLLMILSGCVWAMQGLGAGPAAIMQGPMVNDIHWTYYGVIFAVIGVAEIVWSWMRAKV
jgi:hypothetical protein